jgi:4-amino-4-deoxy-L-arabinose transferase-like glycosyltransferase
MTKPKFFTAALLVAILLGLLLRGYQLQQRFLYTHDNDLNSWIVKDVVVDHHLRLIGQLTSAPGIFIGPLFYYLLIPFYLLSGMDPGGSLYFSLFIGLSAVVSIYYVVGRIHSPLAGKIAALLYAVSELVSRTEREVVPTTPVMLWTIWCYFAVNAVFRGEKKGLLIAAILFALVWHLNLALILLAPVFVVGFCLNLFRSKFTWRDLLVPLVVFIILSAPLFLFESRHGFIQTRALFTTLVSAPGKSAAASLPVKVSHVVSYALKNINGIFWTSQPELPPLILPGLLILGFAALLITRRLPGYLAGVFILWMGLYIGFFTFHPINLSEYYLNGMNIFWFVILALILAELFRLKSLPRALSLAALSFLIFQNLNSFLLSPINTSGYLERKAVVKFIAQDSQAHNYPCVSVSYITNPGYELGYRYFFYLENMHVNQPKSGSPVYTIVYPHPLVDRLDRTFGALGLILPDYDRYSPEAVKLSCMGDNSNLTDPMFGFTR